MKSTMIWALLGVVLLVARVQAGCGDAASTTDDGEVTAWFKNIGCTIKKGAEDLSDTAKPWADKIGSSAKDFGSSVAQKYDEIKHKLTDETASGSTPTPLAAVDAPTEKIPLAPLSGDGIHAASAGEPAPGQGVAGSVPSPVAHVTDA